MAGIQGKKALVHFNNAPFHNSKFISTSLVKYPFKLIPNPIYSPDISPLEFGVFGTVKDKLPYETIDTEDLLKEIIESILSDIGTAFFQKLFREREERLQKYIDSNGDYV